MWSLAWPWVLLALPLPLIARKLLSESASLQDAGLKVPDLAAFAVLRERRQTGQFLSWRFWIAVVAWVLLVVAAARPERIGDEVEVPVSGRNLMLAVDLSGSMDQKDFELGGRRVDRLTATKAVASDFISRREGDRIGLILFGERAYLQVPLTLDRETVRVLLLEAFIGLAGEKTAIGDAITLAVKRIHDQDADASEQVLVLLTDGANTAGEIDPIKAAELAQQVGLRVYTIGIGAEQLEVSSLIGGRRNINPSADLDEETLTGIAEMTGGRYFRAKDTAGLQDIYRLVDELEPVAEPEAGFRPIKSLYYWPLGGAFALASCLCLVSLLKSLAMRPSGELPDAV
ncbi:MAG: VWA domain-containing protein [Gammaproteobacteria bacterium]|nr:VWA domain-containing protein [Gammaproteobacteria bacterium]MDH3374092.1 VWA domain-containing protein [Gammaproteobacteria bacterium]MDH3408782.1 VWA domain-containing protein [Gammaproteobacteria bacterium]MDH3551599.1 VWA domain-containing protein [Gammaproteobacteria bacterium]